MSGAHAPAPPPGRDRRIRTVVAVGTLLVVLVTAVWFSVQSLTSVGEDPATVTQAAASPAPTSPEEPDEPEETTSEQDEADPEQSPDADAEQIAFEAPSGNIACVLDGASARCDIAERSWDQGEPPADCDGTWGASLAVDASGAREVCATDSALGAGQVLEYGSTATQGDVVCRSEESGVTCENTETGNGFTMSRAAYETF